MKDRINKRKEALLREMDAHRHVPEAEIRYYLSAAGDDAHDGLSPETAWKTTEALSRTAIPPGAEVLFRRGDIFRGSFTARPGVTYASWGDHPQKPAIYGSPFDGAGEGSWLQVCPGVWRYSEKLADDCGLLVMDGGKVHTRKIVLNYSQAVPYDNVTGQPFRGPEDMEEDLSFWHDLGGPNIHRDGGGYLYLCSQRGNPAHRFGEIEFLPRKNVIGVGGDGITFDDLRVMYGGAHGIGAGTVDDLTVTHCEFGWIGGGVQFYREGRPTRFGNAVEIYGGCRRFTVHHCRVWEIYDAGLTWQFSAGGTQPILMDGVRFTDNLIEKCSYSIEYFLGKPDDPAIDRQMKNIELRGNLMLDAGYGWGNQRPDTATPAHIKAWDHYNRLTGSFCIADNIMADSRYMMLHIGVDDPDWMPEITGNLLLQHTGGQFGRLGKHPTAMIMADDAEVPGEKSLLPGNTIKIET